MINQDIVRRKKILENKKKELESGQLNAVRQLLSNEVIQQICEECLYGFRNRLLTPLVTVFHMIGAGMSREGSFQSAWHFSGNTGQSGSLAKARQRLPLTVWTQLHQWICKEIEKETEDEYRWKGHRMVGTDGTTVSMSDEPQLAEHFGSANPWRHKSRFPVGRVTLTFDLKTLVALTHEVGPYRRAETELLKQMLGRLRAGDVLVADHYFAGAPLYAKYLEAGVEFITPAHHALKIERLEVIETFSEQDQVVKLPINRQYRRKDPSLPEYIPVRLIQITAKIKGVQKTFWIMTSLLDAKKYPASEIRMWMKRRWKVETLIEELKIWLGADVLRSKTVEGIYKELYARIIGLNLIHWLILKAAKKHLRQPEQISVSATLRLTTAYSLKMSVSPFWQLRELYDELLDRIAVSRVPLRPERSEPRMIKRDGSRYPALKISRQEWRQSYGLAA